MHQSGDDQGYSRLAKLLHWATALIIFAMIPLGLYMTSLAPSPFTFDLYYYHKSFGMLVLGLVLLRLGWRVYAPPPGPLASYALWELYLSRLVHIALYALLFGLPVSGWLMSSSGDFPVIVFGLEFPHLLGENEALFNILRAVHYYAAFVIAGLVLLHIAGALKHHFADRDITLKRILPARGGMIVLGIVLAAVIGAYSSAGYILLGQAGEEARPTQTRQAAQVSKGEKTQETAPVQAQGDLPQWQLLTGRSQLNFRAYQQGSPVTGTFGEFSGVIAFDSQKLGQGHAEISISLTSVETGSADRDDRLKGETWFHTVQYPEARYVIERFVQRKGQGNYLAKGRLHLRGQSAPVDLPFHLDISADGKGRTIAHAKGRTQIKRLNYGVGQGRWQKGDTIANTIDITIDVYAVRIDE